ncbi:MAG: type I DNA topoisomerase [Candidatus Omnitrophota bacterium]|jgi:DNA topoisomerase-1|nr:MAG: type I DNA topoisomerase [Candidatus Omnitrophota bacterium]
MSKKDLIIVESPTKAKTIGKILGDKFTVVSSMGHVIDLPQKKLGVDIENGFLPEYTVLSGRNKVLTSLKKDAKEKSNIYVATDPDREGEAIGWHLKERVFKNKKVFRLVFHEITPSAIKEAFSKSRDFDMNMIEAQASRRILDRLVGYFLSPLLWKKIVRGLSAGRVQSVALRILIERERQINNFVPKEYWEIEAELEKADGQRSTDHGIFTAKLDKIDDRKAEIANKKQADDIVAYLSGRDFIVSDIKKTEKKKNPLAPFITSTLQQEAFNKFRFNATRTMMLAQQLYEGIDIGRDSPVGLITYMRTDSPRVAPEAIREVRGMIQKKFGAEYLPKEPNAYKVKKLAQEAHEAIRPTMIDSAPDAFKDFLTPDQYKLYELIYNRFVSSQMTPAKYLTTTAAIECEKYLFSASGSVLTFDGFLKLYANNEEEEDNSESQKNKIPELKNGEVLKPQKLIPSQHFTKPPARFSDSSLVKALEEDGIGRPSTYAPIIQTLILRDYVRRIKGYFHPTELGTKVVELLIEYFPKVMDLKFTALMEEELDEIEEGKLKRADVLNQFYSSFKANLDFAQKNIKKEVIETDQVCESCGKPMIVKWGRRGKFLSCSDFPKCKSSKSITSGVKCPEAGCGGELIERRSRRGFFYGCSNFPKCRFTSRTLPEEK